MCFFCKISIKSSTYFIALILSVLVLVSCTKLQSDVTSFSEKVKETFQAKNKETVTAGRLNLREEPSSQSRVLSVLRKGDELEVHHLNGKWARVKTSDGRQGWVYARYITGFNDLFADKQPAAEIRKSTQKSGTGQSTDTEKTAGKQQVVSRDKTALQNPENQDPAESAPEKPSYPAPAVADSPTDDRDAGDQPVSDSEIETTEIPPAAGSESGADAEGEIASIQVRQSSTVQKGPSVFSHSGGLFSLQIPMDWDNNTENQDYFEKYIFTDPSREMEVWVVYTTSEDYSEDEFYRDLASLLMERSGARTVISPSTRQKAGTGPEWLYGKVEIKSKPVKTHEYWIKEHDGRLWAITEVYNQTAAEAASRKLFEIRRSFAFGPKPASAP